MAKKKGMPPEEVIQVVPASEGTPERKAIFDRTAIALRDRGDHNLSKEATMAKRKNMTMDEALQVILASNGDNPFRDMLEFMVQSALEFEMSTHLGAEPYERNGQRLGYRSGHRTRVFTTRVGDLELLIPQDRDGTFSTSLFECFQRSEKALALSLMEMYVQGVSTRKVAAVTETLCGRSFSSCLQVWAAKTLIGERTIAGRCVSAITSAITRVFPEPVMPLRTWNFSPARTPSEREAMAAG